jgi:hypothetical protein
MNVVKLSICLIALFLGGTSCKQNASNTSESQTTSGDAKNRKAAEIDFKLVVEKPKSAEFNEIYALLQKEDVLQNFINGMNDRIEFPGEVAIIVTECGENNAFYNPENSTISICYEFLQHTMAMQDEKLSPKEKLLNATAFTFLHEMGHALVDKLDLPITGKEENAVDELAMVLLMSDTTDETYFAAIEGAVQFYQDALDEDLHKFPYYDVHAPSIERYYDMLTIIVGANPESEKEFVGENDKFKLHPDRAENAEYEYNKKLNSWKTLLGAAWRE